ncbi:MAG: sulfatase-like hydrolase/transferase [Acidobacteriota bacterium]|nr:sulfatase-like hydrolase/transferase [Acidobacteriota bacterium]
MRRAIRHWVRRRLRRHPARSAGLVLFLAVPVAPAFAQPPADFPPPNILWVSSEDNGPHLGAYGDDYATTPNLDRLAARGLVYRNAWSTVPVCAPARTTIISGLYPASTGAQHMRSRSRLPDGFRFFPQVLREAGYYVTNNSKEDYNLEKPGGQGAVWHESSRQAHWRNRPEGAPFFAVFNFTVTHESQIRRRPHAQVHDPAGVRVPAYHPDTPEVRQDWAQYYDKLTEMDALVGERLTELEAAGLADDTIVFYWGDHGPGLPRGKRAALQTGLHVPLIVSIPGKYRHLAPADYEPGGDTDRLVGFIDFAPTMLSLAGIEPPAHFQGRAFLGAHEAEPNEVIFGFSDRMDERYDLVRSVRDKRYLYARNFLIDRPYGQRLSYQMETPTTQVWLRLFQEGKLNEAQARFWREKPSEELYDLENDPDLVENVAGSPDHEVERERLAATLRRQLLTIRDLSFLPEGEMHRRAADMGSTPWTYGQGGYQVERVLAAAELATDRSEWDDAATDRLRRFLGDPDSAVRTWAAIGLRARGEAAVQASLAELRAALRDSSAPVRIHAAEALGRFGEDPDRQPVVELLLASASIEENDFFDALLALNALDYLDPEVLGGTGSQAEGWRDRLAALPEGLDGLDRRFRNYVPRLLEAIALDLPAR